MTSQNYLQSSQPAGQIDTKPLRARLERINAAAASFEIETSLDKALKLSTLEMNLIKPIRDTEIYNQKIKDDAAASQPSGTLEARLEGYIPSAQELKSLRAKLKDRLEILGPRLFEDDAL